MAYIFLWLFKKVFILLLYSFLDPRLWTEGSYELESVRPSFRPDVFVGLAH